MSTGSDASDTQDLPVAGQPWWNAAGSDPGAEPAAGDASAPSFDGAAHELAGLPAPRTSDLPPSAGLTRTGRPARAADPGELSPVRALAGAAVAVAGVALGIGTLLWASDSPDPAGPVVTGSAAQTLAGSDDVATDGVVPDGVAPQAAAPQAAAPEAAPPQPASPDAAAPVVVPPAAQPSAAPAPPPAQARPASVVVPVTVLNNSRSTGLAARAAERFEAGGWPVRETGNFNGRLRETTVYYAPGQEEAAQTFARTFRGITRVLPRFETLPGEGLTVVLTRDFES